MIRVACMVVLLLVVAYCLYSTWSTKHEYMTGVWYMTPEFCRGAEVTGTVVTISEDTIEVKATDDESVASTKMRYSASESVLSRLDPHRATYTLYIDEDNELGFPGQLTCEVDMTSGSMRMYDGDTEYADMRKFMT